MSELPRATAHGPLEVVATDHDLELAVARLGAGTGPIAVDAERANGFRYSSKAYLVQLFRRGAGTVLIDPLEITAWPLLQKVLSADEWVLHAASQDLPCLAEIGLEPATLFDTELGARLAGFERVGLAAVVEKLLGLHLAKEHSASDWSARPLPTAQLEYAALDVEVLLDVRDAVEAELIAQHKLEFAKQEFDATRTRLPKPATDEPWRRLSGLHQVRDRKQLGIAKALWEARDELARDLDSAPGRLIPDRSLVVAVLANPMSKGQLASTEGFHGRASRSQLDRWWAAIEAGRNATNLPKLRLPSEGPPPPRFWKTKRPKSAHRLDKARPAVLAVAEALKMPTENLLTPDTLRRLAWDDSVEPTVRSVSSQLGTLGARAWQIDATAQAIAAAFVDADQVLAEEAASDS